MATLTRLSLRFAASFMLGGAFSYLLSKYVFGYDAINEFATLLKESRSISQSSGLARSGFPFYYIHTVAVIRLTLFSWLFTTVVFFTVNWFGKDIKATGKKYKIVYSVGVLGIFILGYILFLLFENTIQSLLRR